MKKVLLDTNAYTAFLSGDENILDVLSRADTVFFSCIVLGELLAGFKGGTKEKANRKMLDMFIQRPTVRIQDVTAETAEVFAGIKDGLRQAGNPIPINDVWIAGQALETGAVLITFDRHFRKVPGLRIWPEP